MSKYRVTLTLALVFMLTVSLAGVAGAVDLNSTTGYLMQWELDNEGELVAVVEAYSGELQRFSVSPSSSMLSIDGVPVQWSDLKPGLEVIATADRGRLLRLEAFSAPKPGYIAPGSRVVKGTVTGIDRDKITVKGDNGQEGLYCLAPFTIVTKAGQARSFDVLYSGDRVKLYFDEVDSQLISRMEIEGDSVLVSALYRGTLQLINPVESKLACSQVDVFHNGVWVQDKSASTWSCHTELPVYLSGLEVPRANLKYYRDKAVYLLGKKALGQEAVERLIIKGPAEYTYTGILRNYNPYSSEFEINNKNCLAGEGTVIIKDGRLQEQGVLYNGGSAVVIADTWGERPLANIIYILDQDLNNSELSQHHLYAGRLDIITEDSLWLRNAYKLYGNSFERVGDEVQLYYGSDVKAYDRPAGEWITAPELLSGPYAVDEDSGYSREQGLRDWYAYIYTDADHIVGLMMGPERINPDILRVSTGKITGVENDPLVGWSINLTEGCDWSQHNRQWMPKQLGLRLGMADALIIKNGQAISADKLRPGDRLYMLRDDFHVQFAVVK